MTVLQFGKSEMSCVGARIRQRDPPLIVKLMHFCGIAREPFWRCDFLEVMVLPEAALATKGTNAALCRKSRAGQEDDLVGSHSRCVSTS